MSKELAIELSPLPSIADAKTIATAFDFAMQEVTRPNDAKPIRLVFSKAGEAARVSFHSGDVPLHALLAEPSTRPFATTALHTFATFARSFCARVTITDPVLDAPAPTLRWFAVREIEVQLAAPFETEGKRVSRYLRNAWVRAVDAKSAQLLAVAKMAEDGAVVNPGKVVPDEAPPEERAGEAPVIPTGRIFFPDS